MIKRILQIISGKLFFVWKLYTLIFIAALTLFNANSYSQTQKEIEYKLEAAYLLHFLQFVEWPDSVFENEKSPLVITILGDDPFGNILDEITKSEKIGEHSIIIKRVHSLNNLRFCNVLYISSSERENFKSILKHIDSAPVLTISDIDDFSEQGGNISFYLEENKIRFAINIQTLKQADLKVSSKLLRLAKIVNPL
jgi:YfiR/HmsC-like